MQDLEVGHLRRVPGIHQGLEPGLDERGDPTAEDRLLTEEIGLGLLCKRRLEYDRAGRADPAGVGERDGPCRPRGVLVDGNEGRDALTFLVGTADHVAGTLRGDHHHIDGGRRNDLAVVDIETMGEHQTGVFSDIGADLGAVDCSLILIGEEDLDDVGALDRFGHGVDLKTIFGCSLPAAAGPQANDDPAPGITQVQRLATTLGAIADDGDGLALQGARVRIGLIVFLHHRYSHPVRQQT